MIGFYVTEIRESLRNKCYFAALSLSLMLPDICGIAEYPDYQVAKRYITWYDTYIGKKHAQERMYENEPYLSGEVVYNLRNTFFHQGSPNIITEKVKDVSNKIDRFTLILGDGSFINTMAFTVNVADVWCRDIIVDVSFLCNMICDAALWYYSRNKEKFIFNFQAIPQDFLFGKESPLDHTPSEGDPLLDALNTKLEASGKTIRVEDNITKKLMERLRRQIDEDPTSDYGAGNSQCEGS